MKYFPFFIFGAALTIASSSVMAYELCWHYKNKNDITGYNACESRNTAESRNETERKAQKERENADRERSEAAERNAQNFREKQLDLQRQQLETQKQNSYKPTINDATEFQKIHELVLKIQGPVNSIFKKQITSGNCSAATELAEVVMGVSALEVIIKAKATGRQLNEQEAVMSVFGNGIMEFGLKCNDNPTKQKKK